jgi:RNA polymerase subunit RPABC4/transcription elongation factor Spt4
MRNSPNVSPTIFKDEWKLLPRYAWGIVVLGLLAWYGLAVPAIVRTVPAHPNQWAGGMERFFISIVMSFVGLILGLWITLIFYVNQDAKRRYMSRAAWTLITLFIPYGIGFVVYFVVRKPIPQSCPQCHALVGNDFVFCPACKHELRTHCPTCQRLVEMGWVNCAYCGTGLGK